MKKSRSKPMKLDTFLEQELSEAFRVGDETRALRAIDVFSSGGQIALPGMEAGEADPKMGRKMLGAIHRVLPISVPYATLQDAYARRPDLRFFVSYLINQGPEALYGIVPIPFIPVQPAQALRFNSGEEALEQVGEGTWLVEPKLDGWECQIHCEHGEVRVFSRTGLDWTTAVPDVAESAEKFVGSEAAILEGEMLAVDPNTGKDCPRGQMQVTSVSHRVVVFDVMYWNGDQTRNPCAKRCELLAELFRDRPSRVLRMTEQVQVNDRQEFLSHLNYWLSTGLEGMIAKRPYAIYEAGRRTRNRIKIKVIDTVDALLVGYNSDTQSYLAAVLDENTDEYVPFVWIYSASGLKSEERAELDNLRLKARIPDAKPIDIAGKWADVILNPLIVAEVGGDHIYPADYPCGVNLTGKGWSLFGAKFIRIREDKRPEDVTTLREFLTLPVMAGHARPELKEPHM